MSTLSASNICDSAGYSEAEAKYIWCGTKFVVPRYWIHQGNSAEMVILQIKLSGCTKDQIKVKIWNWRLLLVHATCQFHEYRLEYKLPTGARLLFAPKFAAQTEILTCRFHGFHPTCVVCHTSFPHHPIATQGTFGIVFQSASFQVVQPRHWISYDGKAALFQAHLEGCKNSSQINFHIANDKVMILAVSSPQLHYFLSLRLESSAQTDWKAHFDRKVEMFTCSIPLLGHYECGKCMAKRRHHDGEGASKGKAEKSVGTLMEKAGSSGCSSDSNGQESRRSHCHCYNTVKWEEEDFNPNLDFIRVSDQNNSWMSASTYRETQI